MRKITTFSGWRGEKVVVEQRAADQVLEGGGGYAHPGLGVGEFNHQTLPTHDTPSV